MRASFLFAAGYLSKYYRAGGMGGLQFGSDGSHTGIGPPPPATMIGAFCLAFFGITAADNPSSIRTAMAPRTADFIESLLNWDWELGSKAYLNADNFQHRIFSTI
jgi:hypothetical protein